MLRTFWETHDQFIQPWCPNGLNPKHTFLTRDEVDLSALGVIAHIGLPWNPYLPLHEIHRTVSRFHRLRIESLYRHVKSWSFGMKSRTHERMILSPLLSFFSEARSADSGHDAFVELYEWWQR
jgi:hypothetical protein